MIPESELQAEIISKVKTCFQHSKALEISHDKITHSFNNSGHCMALYLNKNEVIFIIGCNSVHESLCALFDNRITAEISYLALKESLDILTSLE